MMTNRIKIPVVVCIFLAVYVSQASANVNEHVLRIEMSTTYKFGTTSMIPIAYCFDAWMEVDETVESGSVQPPGSDPCDARLEVDGESRWLGIGVHSSNLDGMDGFVEGTYTFTVNYTGGGSDSTTVEYSLENGDPIPPVDQPLEATYPVNGAVGVPLAISFDLEPLSDPNWTYSVIWAPDNGDPAVKSGEIEGLEYTTTSVGPIVLSPGILYEVELNVAQVLWSVNSDGISYVVDKDSERFLYFTTVTDGHVFILNSDINFDGYVNFLDFSIMAEHWLEGVE